MGKTVGAILTIGVAIAVNVIPGVGQAISGAIVGLGAAPSQPMASQPPWLARSNSARL